MHDWEEEGRVPDSGETLLILRGGKGQRAGGDAGLDLTQEDRGS